MRWSRRGAFRATAVALLVLAGLSCGEVESAEEGAAAVEGRTTQTLTPELSALKEKFDPFQDFAQAQAGGYGEAITSCWYNRASGAQGTHYSRIALIDDVISPMDPEVMMYEPQEGGRLELTGLAYVVPYARWTGSNPPILHGQAFHRNDVDSLWVLHAWLWRDNPAGLHADWNPAVSCEHSPVSEERTH
jgi:hypothetical protein